MGSKEKDMKHIKRIVFLLTTAAILITGCQNPNGSGEDDNVNAFVVRNVTLSETTKNLYTGNEFYLMAIVTPSTATNQNVFWESDNPDVAAVDGDGHTVSIRGVAEGTAIITVTTQDGGKAARCEVTVLDTPIPVTAIELNTDSLFLVVTESPFILRAQIEPWYANVGNELTWSITPPGIAELSDTSEGTNLAKLVTALAAGEGEIKITSGNGIEAACPIKVATEDFGTDIQDVILRVGESSRLYSVFRPASIVPDIASVTWESADPSIATVTAAGDSGLDSFSARVTGITEGETRLTLTAGGLVSYTDVKVLPAWNIAGDWFFEDFEDYRFNSRNPDLGGTHPLNQTSSAASNHWTVAAGLSNTGATFGQIVTMENSMPATDTLGGQNKVGRSAANGNGNRASQYNFKKIIAGDKVYVEFDWYPASPDVRWGFISLNDRTGTNGNNITNKIISFRSNAAMELSYNVGNIAETQEETDTAAGIRIFESLDSSYYWFHVKLEVDFNAGTVSFEMKHLESGVTESVSNVPLPSDISYNHQIAAMRMFVGRPGTGWRNFCLDNVYFGTAPMPQPQGGN
jgi:uncharacterized protein YjdB